MLGVQRSSFMNMLGELKDLEILDFSSNEIKIINRKKLTDILNLEKI